MCICIFWFFDFYLTQNGLNGQFDSIIMGVCFNERCADEVQNIVDYDYSITQVVA